jgi:queuosine biosynthesis protein QueD
MFATVTKEFIFDAAHKITQFGEGHKCARLHGHTWRVLITVAGAVDPLTGVVIDYYELKKAWEEIHKVIDHNYLTEIPGLEIPTTENIASWIWQRLIGPLSSPEKKWQLSRIVIHEGHANMCEFFGAV